MSLRVEDSKKLLVKLVGTERVLSQERLANFFRAFLMTRVKSYLAQEMKKSAINIFEVDAHLVEISEALKKSLEPDFADYGIKLERFFVTTIATPDGDPQYERFKDLYFRQYADIAEAQLHQKTAAIAAQTEAQKTLIESQALAAKRQQEGYSYQEERSFDVAEAAAQNESVGQFTNMGIGLGAIASVGNAVGGTINQAMSQAFPGTQPAAQTPQSPQATTLADKKEQQDEKE